jgi:hypothetical protein
MKRFILCLLLTSQHTFAMGCAGGHQGTKTADGEAVSEDAIKKKEAKEDVAKEDGVQPEKVKEGSAKEEEGVKENDIKDEALKDDEVSTMMHYAGMLRKFSDDALMLDERDSSICRNGNRIGRALGGRIIDKLAGDCDALVKIDLLTLLPQSQKKLINSCKEIGILEAQVEQLAKAEHCDFEAKADDQLYQKCWKVAVEGMGKTDGRFSGWDDEAGQSKMFFQADLAQVMKSGFPELEHLDAAHKLSCISGALHAWTGRN